MPSSFAGRLAEATAAVKTAPTLAQWRRCAVWYGVFLAVAVPIGLEAHLIHASIPPVTGLQLIGAAGMMFLHPALTEEIVFRGLMLPRGPGSRGKGRLAVTILVALAVYVAAHPLNALLFWPAALPVFTNPVYLALAALLGLTCTAAYLGSESIWPPVLIHWVTVVAWIFFFGGQGLLSQTPA